MTVQEFDTATKCVKNFGFSGDMSRVKNGSFMNEDVPADVDWRWKRAVTYVRNQGNCRSCWAFATAGAIEGLHKIETRELLALSAQQLVDCTGVGHDCFGGEQLAAFEHVRKRLGGITEEVYYRYEGMKQLCQEGVVPRGVTIAGVERVSGEADLQRAVARGPVAVVVKFGSRDIQNYNGGVFTGYCGPVIEHSVLVVGYGEGTIGCCYQKYWIIKNSWGATWGEYGYMRIQRDYGRDGKCGIATRGLLPFN
eukprot:PITA_20370